MKNENLRSILTTVFSIAFAFILCFSAAAVQDASAQRYLTEIKATSEVKGISQFAADLDEFLKLAEYIEQENIVSPRDIARLEAAGKKVKDGTGNLRGNLKNLIGNLKNKNRWDEQLDAEINDLLGSRKIKGFFQRSGGRTLLTQSETAINAINGDVDAIVAGARKTQSANSNGGGEGSFVKASFSSAGGGGKVRFKCVVLGLGILGAELAGAKRTAENLDKIFDKGCGAGAAATT